MSAPVGPPAEPGDKRRRILVAASGVVALAVLATVALALNVFGGDERPQAGSVGQTSSAPADSLPPDERCTREIMSNRHWVCLTSAIIANGRLTIDYRGDGSKYRVKGGIHLHIYGSDGTNPADRVMGRQVPDSEQGEWYNEDHKAPIVLDVTDPRFTKAIGDAKKVCARIADGDHLLVPDADGTYATGNCVSIRRTGTSAPPVTDDDPPPDNNDPPVTEDPTTTTEPTTTTWPSPTEEVPTDEVPTEPAEE